MTGHFLQSKEWEEFQRALKREVFRVQGILFIKLPLALGRSYLYSAGAQFPISPTSPTGLRGASNFQFPNNFQNSKFQTLAKQHNVIFLKFEPMIADESLAQNLLKSGFSKSEKAVQPQKTIILDLTKGEEELLAEMHQKTRYNIRVAERKGLRIMNHESGITEDVFEEFWQILQKTAGKDGFSTHPKQYYKKFLESFSGHNSLFIIRNSENKIIAANIMLFHSDTAYYLHGASDYEYRNLMAPYLLHWETIKYAKKHGYKNYDFWGIDEQKWPGVTRFKRGFEGREIQYIGSFDYVFQPLWYKFYKCGLYLRSRLTLSLPRRL